jgi:N-acetyl-anhydromuramyl-L-alanine amidase AmpD
MRHLFWMLSLALCGGCEPQSSDMPSIDDIFCEDACGLNAHCDEAAEACACDDGFYGAPLIECEHVDVHAGWIGSPCDSDSVCDYADGFCLTEQEGYPDGHCSQDCELYCPDMDGMPITFCIEPSTDSGGHCFARCDYDAYPVTEGCRPDYACVPWLRNGTSTEELTCVPDIWVEDEACSNPLNFAGDDDCYLDLVAMGDNTLRDLSDTLLRGVATPAEALAFLDRNHEQSQVFIEEDLGSTIHPNYSDGHLASSPMRGAIVHYTAGQREDGTIRYFVRQDPHASTHFVIGSYRNGLVVQIFSHENRTWHAGSTYNKDRFGFDFANAGYLVNNGDGWETYAGTSYDMMLPLFGRNPVEITDGIPGEGTKYSARDFWQPYTYYQLLSYVMVMRALHLVYDLDLNAIERHGDVASSRVDPGPALPMTALNLLVFNTEDVFQVDWLNAYKVDPHWIETHPQAR